MANFNAREGITEGVRVEDDERMRESIWKEVDGRHKNTTVLLTDMVSGQ